MKYQGLIWAGLFVEDLEASIIFYRDVLGLQLLGQGEDWAHFDAGNGSLFELFSGGKTSAQPKTSTQQSLVLGMRVDNLEDTMEELKRRGVRFTGEIGEFEGTRWVPFSDPEGNLLEIKEIPA